MTPPEAGGQPAEASALGNRDFRLLLVATAALFSGYALLLPVVPLWAVRNGSGEVVAGATTGIFMASTVLTQLAVPRLARAWGYRAATAAGGLLLGLPAPVLAVAVEPVAVLGLSLVRGVGFGLLTVSGSALIAELLPSREVPRGSGLYGAAAGLPQLVFLPAGVWLVERWGFAGVFALAAALPLAGLLALIPLPRLYPLPVARGVGWAEHRRPVLAATWRPWTVMLVGSIGFGSLATFVPLVLAGSATAATLALLAMSTAVLLARFTAGQLADRVGGPGRMLPVSLAAIGVGLGGVAVASWLGGAAGVVAAAAVFGIGFGVVQNDALVAMFARAASGPASVGWNIAFDAGQGAGAVVVGSVVAQTSFGVAFGAIALLAVVVLPVAARARIGYVR